MREGRKPIAYPVPSAKRFTGPLRVRTVALHRPIYSEYVQHKLPNIFRGTSCSTKEAYDSTLKQ